jgi:hypothetical protein
VSLRKKEAPGVTCFNLTSQALTPLWQVDPIYYLHQMFIPLPAAFLPLSLLSLKQRPRAIRLPLPLSSVYLYSISNRDLQQLIHDMNQPVLHPPYSPIFFCLFLQHPCTSAHEPCPPTQGETPRWRIGPMAKRHPSAQCFSGGEHLVAPFFVGCKCPCLNIYWCRLTIIFHVAAQHNSSLSICRYYSHNNDYLEICRCYKAIYDIPSIKEDQAKWTPVISLSLSE